MRVEAFTDGACTGNPGIGGWGVLLRCGSVSKSIAGGDFDSTNNQMELMGAIVALESLTKPCSVTLTTDSQYVQKGITQWISEWRRRGRMDPNHRKAVANIPLWLRLEKAASRHQVEWVWVRGHDGHEGNEIADKLAVSGKALILEHGPLARLVNDKLEIAGVAPGSPEQGSELRAASAP